MFARKTYDDERWIDNIVRLVGIDESISTWRDYPCLHYYVKEGYLFQAWLPRGNQWVTVKQFVVNLYPTKRQVYCMGTGRRESDNELCGMSVGVPSPKEVRVLKHCNISR